MKTCFEIGSEPPGYTRTGGPPYGDARSCTCCEDVRTGRCLDLIVTDVQSVTKIDANGNVANPQDGPIAEILAWLQALKVRFDVVKDSNFPYTTNRHYTFGFNGSVYCDVCEVIPPCSDVGVSAHTDVYENYLSMNLTKYNQFCANYVQTRNFGGNTYCIGGGERYEDGLWLTTSIACGVGGGTSGPFYFGTPDAPIVLPDDWGEAGFSVSQQYPIGTPPGSPTNINYRPPGPCVLQRSGSGGGVADYAVDLTYKFTWVEDCPTCPAAITENPLP